MQLARGGGGGGGGYCVGKATGFRCGANNMRMEFKGTRLALWCNLGSCVAQTFARRNDLALILVSRPPIQSWIPRIPGLMRLVLPPRRPQRSVAITVALG